MVDWIIVLNLGLILLALLGMAAYAYLDAPEYDMNPKKWAAISFFIPFFGFFAYIFERYERKPKPETDPEDQFVGGGFKIHKSRAEDVPWLSDEEVKKAKEESQSRKGEGDS